MQETSSPIILKQDRILYLDILRGIAILFIFIANISFFSGWRFLSESEKLALATPKLDHILDMILFALINGKFYSIFSILFGIGFAVQYQKFVDSQRNFVPFIRRRMIVLVLLGGIHLFFIWLGDILTLYALLGLVLILFRHFSDRRLIVWAVVLLILPVVHYLFMLFTGAFYPYLLYEVFDDYAGSQGMTIKDWNNQGYESFSFKEYFAITDTNQLIKINVGMPLNRLANILLEGRIFKVLALFLLGIWAGRHILLHNLLENKGLLKKILLWGLVIGLPMNIIRTCIEFGIFKGEIWDILNYVTYAAGVVPLACAYAALIALSMQKNQKILSWFAPVGKAALTNYIFQSIISIFIFYKIGLGFINTMGFFQITMLAIFIFICQLILSTIWLTYFRFGLLEWIWRMLTYGKWISILKKRQNAIG
ncbi:DUF418 domain-containing protein [soil metagenome]